MIGRRAAIVSAATVSGLLTITLTNTEGAVFRLLGIGPRQLAKPSEASLLDAVIADQRRLIQFAQSTEGADEITAILTRQLQELGGIDPAMSSNDTQYTPTELGIQLARAAEHRCLDALEATTPEVAQLFSSLSSSFSQAVYWTQNIS